MILTELPRNDLKACLDYYKGQDGGISFEEYRVMLDAQDDRSELEEISMDWEINDWIDDLLVLPKPLEG